MFGFIGRAGGAAGGWIKGLFGKMTQSVSLVSPYLRGMVWAIRRDFVVLAREAYGGNSAVYASLKVLASSVAEPPLLAYQLNAKEEKIPLPFEHPLMKLIRQPNPLQTESKMWNMVTLHYSLVGRSHWWMQPGNLNRPIALWPLRPDRVSPKYAEQPKNPDGTPAPRQGDAVMKVLEGWVYWEPGQGTGKVIPLDQVLTFISPDPAGESGGLGEGLGPVQVIAREAEVDNEITAFTAALLRNSAMPGIIVSVKQSGLSRAEARDIKRGVMAQFGGPNRGEPAVIDGDTTITTAGYSPQQMENSTLRNFTESRISAVLGVPAILAQLFVGIMAGIKATIDEQREMFTETTLTNLWRDFSDQYTLDVASKFGDRIVCRFDMTKVKALAAQQAAETLKYADGFVKGAVTVDEYRDLVLHLAPIGGDFGESVYLPMGTVPTPTTDEFVKQPPSEIGDDSAISAMLQGPMVDEDGNVVQGKGRRLRLAAKAAMAPPPDRAADDEALRAALADLFDGLQGDIAGRIRRHEMISDNDLALAFQRVLRPSLGLLFSGAMLRLAHDVGIEDDPAVVSTMGSAWASGYVPTLVRGLTDTTRAVITNAITAFGNTPGMTIGDVRALIEPAFGANRARVIATTEITRVHAAVMQSYQDQLSEQGIAMERVFHTDSDELVCPRCGPLNGRPESEWGVTDGPPLHPSCRCHTSLRLITPSKSAALVRVA